LPALLTPKGAELIALYPASDVYFRNLLPPLFESGIEFDRNNRIATGHRNTVGSNRERQSAIEGDRLEWGGNVALG